MSTMDDETKQEIVDAYLKANPTPENSMDIVNELAEELGKSANSIRMILSNAGVYVKKTAKAATTTSKSSDSDEVKTSRKSKQSSIDDLSDAIRNAGQEVDEAIVSKLTGKAAEYFNSIIRSISK